MSNADRFGGIALPSERNVARARQRIVTAVFGDHLGLTLFLGALAFFTLYWRLGFFINDNITLANTFLAIADGHLSVAQARYGDSLATPGMHVVDGRYYGRNYGQLFLSLPFLYALKGVALVTEPRIGMSAIWSLLLLGTFVMAGRVADREALFAIVGSALALVAFGANVALATPLEPHWFGLMAMQMASMVAAALSAVVLYRLLATIHDRRVGAVAGAALALSTPVGFWATIPKRHAFTTLFVACSLYSLYRARGEGSLLHRALAYVWIGLLSWIHAPEALVALVALTLVDLLTAPENDPRRLALLAGAFAVSLLPMLVTNFAISGNPLEVPRLLPDYEGQGEPTSTDPFASGNTPELVRTLVPTPLVAAYDKLAILALLFVDGTVAAVTRPGKLWATFVYRGYLVELAALDGYRAINLSVLESTPLLGSALALPITAIRKECRQSPAMAVDALAAAYAIGFTLVYLPRLPLYAQVTVRYLLPVFLVALYGVFRLPSIRRSVDDHTGTIIWTYGASVLVGGQLLYAWLTVTGAALGESMQFHALVGLLLGGLLAGWALFSELGSEHDRIGSVLLGLAMGEGTVFLLLSGIAYFGHLGETVLPIIP